MENNQPTREGDEARAREVEPCSTADAWQDLVEKDDRTSPEDYPEMALITYEELADYMAGAAALVTQPRAEAGEGVLEALDEALKQYSEPMSLLNSHELGECLSADVSEIVRHARNRKAAPTSTPPTPEPDRTAQRIGELVEDEAGNWEPCSGCQESVDGYVSERDYPYSPIFRCQPGGGCSECGGIGVIWRDRAYYEMWEKFAPDATPPTPEPDTTAKAVAALNRIADLGTCGRGKTPAHKLFQEAIDIATSALS